MQSWIWWLVAAAVLGAVELGTATLVVGMFAVGALGAAGTGALGGGAIAQALVFSLVSLLMLVVVRPVARRHLRTPIETRSGVAALVGRQATVLLQIDGSGGQVKLAGEVWSARSYDPARVIAPGRTVDVVSIDGATAVVLESES